MRGSDYLKKSQLWIKVLFPPRPSLRWTRLERKALLAIVLPSVSPDKAIPMEVSKLLALKMFLSIFQYGWSTLLWEMLAPEYSMKAQSVMV